MCIVYEHLQWEGEVYYFRSTEGKTPICKVYRKGDGWEVLFYRGPENLGPYPYDLFERAKNHLIRYLVPREKELMGEPNSQGEIERRQPWPWAHPEATGVPAETRRKKHDRKWATRK